MVSRQGLTSSLRINFSILQMNLMIGLYTSRRTGGIGGTARTSGITLLVSKQGLLRAKLGEKSRGKFCHARNLIHDVEDVLHLYFSPLSTLDRYANLDRQSALRGRGQKSSSKPLWKRSGPALLQLTAKSAYKISSACRRDLPYSNGIAGRA